MNEPDARNGGGLAPHWRVVFLLAVVVGVFFLRVVWQTAAACAALGALWLVVGLPPRRLVRQVFKLWGLALLIAVSYAFFENDPETDVWRSFPLGWWDSAPHISVNTSALVQGVAMWLRVLAVILASQVARAGDVRAVAAGLKKLGVPTTVAVSIDTVLALLGDNRGGGGGGGGGGGRRRREEAERGGGGGMGRGGGDGGADAARGGERGGDPEMGRGGGAPVESFWAAAKRIMRGDVGPIVNRLQRQIERGQAYAAEHGMDASAQKGARDRIHDVGVIAGISLTMLGIKALKILPSIPFAPGHKLVLLTPLYIVATLMTRGRMGGTLTGITMGAVAFLMGDGKYGIFEILKHVVPGIICDLCLPLLTARGRRPGGFVWSLFGGVIAAGRFATIFMITFLVQAPAVAYAILIPGFTVHVTFGLLSGYVTFHVVQAIDRLPKSPEPEPGTQEQSKEIAP